MATRFSALFQLHKLDTRIFQHITRRAFSSTEPRGMATEGTSTPVSQRGDTCNDAEDHLKQGPGLLKVLESSPKRLRRIKFLSELFKTNGFELRIAGGAVRDILRGKQPKDIDFATTAPPDQTLQIVSKHEDILRIIVTVAGQKHGTVAVKFKEVEIDFKRIKLSHEPSPEQSDQPAKEPEYDEESPYEITTLRCDILTDGRHSEVEFINDWRLDAERRDLTINAMFLTLDDGKLIDYFGGESDLKHGIVRFVGDTDRRIKEDYLRILRYFRFWSRYGMGKEPDQDTIDKIRANLAGLSQISGERIWQEIRKILSHFPCYKAFELMLKIRLFDYAGLLDENLKDFEEYTRAVLAEVKRVEENITKYQNEVLNPKLAGDPQDSTSKKVKELLPVIIFAAAVQNDTLCLNTYQRLKFSNMERDTILYMIQNRDKTPTLAALKFQLAMTPVSDRHLSLMRARVYLISKGLFEFIDQLEAWKVPQFPINGRFVAKAVSERRLPGNKTKKILELVKLDWAKDDYKTDEDALKQLVVKHADAMKEEASKSAGT